jgi:serine/threonine protein kinase
VRLLGGGERYETYLAWDEKLLALVVVKLLRPHLVGSERALRGLEAEASLLERLRHPVLVRGFGAVLGGPRPHVVLEHLDGPRLSSLLRRHGPLEPEQLLPLALQLGSALHYLAGEGIVHLDVKPSNIIMGAPARLIDLSVARSVRALEGSTRRIGTDPYMAPEQCDPERLGPVTAAADVWGMGAVLYEAASGRRPFPRADEPGAPRGRYPQLLHEPAPLQAGRGLSPRVASVIEACLERDPEARPRPAEVVDALEPLAAELRRRPLLARFHLRPLT